MTINIDRFLEPSEVSGLTRNRDVFTPAPAQTVFVLSSAPSDPSQTMLFVNNVKYLITTDFTVSGSTLTWLDTEFALDASDVVEVIYFN